MRRLLLLRIPVFLIIGAGILWWTPFLVRLIWGSQAASEETRWLLLVILLGLPQACLAGYLLSAWDYRHSYSERAKHSGDKRRKRQENQAKSTKKQFNLVLYYTSRFSVI